MTENFDDIRPYNDSEVSEVLGRLLKNDEFLTSIAKFRRPGLNKALPNISRRLVKQRLKKKLTGINTIDGVQRSVGEYVRAILSATTSGLEVAGLSDFPKDAPHLFISNHRDIVMDPALIGYMLRNSAHGTVQIAIGDNLLKRDYISDLMRLNKSFIVKRSVQGREKLLASKQLSQYIYHALESGSNVWIAQREGRAKDGIDKTDPALLKMLHLSKRDAKPKMSIKDSTDKLRIIPVSISYEYDPCAEMKARELYEIDKHGLFEKDENSDTISISEGLNGDKGNIHLKFGQEIVAEDDDPVNIALQIDQQIVSNYKLHSSNYLAYEKLRADDPSIGPALSELELEVPSSRIEAKRMHFEVMLELIDDELKPYFLLNYANPVISKLK
ncbi:MAG: 1-acyl-sn-glycerol-3-phosphate acyltransferase [Crocinitomicaceae bacterium]|nr:1-acyl-sn-glycerol-3-phosphate acyltransferase [Crocinitomicaceae bacterium]